MTTITINGNTIDLLAPDLVSPNAESSNFIVIQGKHDLHIDEKQQLTDLGVDIQEYVAEHTYLCRYLPKDMEQIRALPFIIAASIYRAEFKGTVSLKNTVDGDADQTEYEVDLILHDKPNITSTALAPYVAQAAEVDINELEVLPRKIRVTVHQDRLSDLAALDSINRIEEVRSKSTYNDHARGILQVDEVFTSLRGNQGAGQTICVADTGFDQGEVADTSSIKVHPAFTGRVGRLESLWLADDSKDPVGHGTHVCGSICGSGTYAGSFQGNEGTTLLQGTAPAAKIMVQSMSKYSTGLKRWILKVPADLSTLFSTPYNLGYRIHNNSWGDKWDPKTGQLGYEADATAIDLFVREHQDFVVLVAAGNDANKENHGPSQIGDNSSAKNCITVGATGSTRPNDGQRYDPSVPPLSGVNDTAIFSSRGPTKATRRIKPDVMAPGVAILSAASRSVAADAAVRTNYGVSKDKDWLFMSGTSQATPLVAGCVALIREALQQQGKQYPSAALVKALLINGAVNFSSKDDRAFDYEQGFGRIDVDSSITMIKQSSFIDGGNKLETSAYDVPALPHPQLAESRWESAPIPLTAGRQNRLIATLAYPDVKGDLLQYDVNLIVQAGGEERHGNMGRGAGFDHINNVEKVIWDNIPGPTATIIVQAYAFTLDLEQSFAAAWDIQTM